MDLNWLTKEINNMIITVSKCEGVCIENFDIKISIEDRGRKVNIFTFKIEKKPQENFPFNNSEAHLMPCAQTGQFSEVEIKK